MTLVRSRLWAASVLVMLAGIVIGVFMSASTGQRDGGAVVNNSFRFLVCLLFAFVVLTSLHEAAHVVVGRLVGWKVFGVTIGRGRRWVTLDIGSMRVELRGTLIGGVTIANAPGQRWRDVAMLGAGVSVESVVIAVALMWDAGPGWGIAAKWALVAVASSDIVGNLWPRRVDFGPLAGMPTDGAQLLSVLTTPDQWRHDIEQHRMTPERAQLVQSLHGGDVAQALELARKEDKADPTDETAAMVGTLLLMADHWREAFDQLAPLADDDDVDPLVANNAAWAAVMTFDPRLLPQADRFSERALAARPTEPACANTRGATLVLRNRPDEGLPLLHLAVAGRLSSEQKAFVYAFTALAHHRLGHFDDVAQSLTLSRSHDHDCPALPEIEQLLLRPASPRPPTLPAEATRSQAPWPPPRAADPQIPN